MKNTNYLFLLLFLALFPLQGFSADRCTSQILGHSVQKGQFVQSVDDRELLEISKKLEISLYTTDIELRKVLLQKGYDENRGFRRMSGKGYPKFRVKTANSIFKKLKKKMAAGAVVTDLESARRLIGDGNGARFVVFDPSRENLELLTEDIVELISSGELSITDFENYYGLDGKPYLSNAQVAKLIDAQIKINGTAPKVVEGKNAIKDSGYTSIHINAILPSGAKIELQIRGAILEQLGEISHIFYDEISGKQMSLHVAENPALKAKVLLMRGMSPLQKKSYHRYLAAAFKLVRQYSTGEQVHALAFPKKLKGLEELSIASIAQDFGFGMLSDLVTQPEAFNHKAKKYRVYDSIADLTANLSDSVLEKVLGNVSQGSVLRTKEEIIKGELDELEAQLKGLNSPGAIVWEESEHLRQRRKVIRSGKKWPAEIDMPEYLIGQKTGPQKMKVSDLHYMQDSANHASGEYSVLGNAKALKEGRLKTSMLPPLQVWRDTTGKVWSLDHRRLAAYELSGVVDKVDVIVVEKELVDEDKFKLSNADGGKSIIIHRDEDNLAYLIVKP